VFRRTTDATCATEVVFPALSIEKLLPLNTDVTIELPAALADEVTFQCGWACLRGMVVAR
jgi:plastocyanin domain-containing protein